MLPRLERTPGHEPEQHTQCSRAVVAAPRRLLRCTLSSGLNPLSDLSDSSAPAAVSALFGDEVADLVGGASSDGGLGADAGGNPISALQSWLPSVRAGIRSVILQLGLRFDSLEGLAEQAEVEDDQPGNRTAVARDTLDLYVPLADRTRMGRLRTRLEDAAFRLLQLAVYAGMSRRIEPVLDCPISLVASLSVPC